MKRQKAKGKSALLFIFTLNLYLFTFTFCLSYAEPERATIAHLERSFLLKRYEKAIYEADRLIDSRSPGRDEIYYLKGLSQLKLNRFKDARKSFDELISKYPRSKRSFDAYVGIGDSYLLGGDVKGAIRAYQDILDRYPDDVNISIVYYRLGNCFRDVGSNDKAKECFDKVKSIAPLSFEAKMISPLTLKKVPQSEGNKYFSVQVGGFKNRRNAEKLTSKLAKEGFASFMEMPASSTDRLYRVKVGRLSSKEEAEILSSRLKKLGYSTKICR